MLDWIILYRRLFKNIIHAQEKLIIVKTFLLTTLNENINTALVFLLPFVELKDFFYACKILISLRF